MTQAQRQFLTTYPARLLQGSTSLLTPNLASLKHVEVPPPPLNERISGRPRPSYRDPSVSPPPSRDSPVRASPAVQQRDGGRADIEVDERGLVTGPVPGPPPTMQRRLAGWIRVRSDYIVEQAAAAAEENLIPIRLDLDLGGDFRLKDVFLWNLNEELITPTEFAVNLVMDLQLPQMYINEIAKEIRKQLEEYAPVANLAVPGQEAPVIVELEVHLSRHLITDKFEWDLQSTAAVEAFTRQTCQDLGLFGEFSVAMSCAIREQLMRLKKELVESPPGRTAEGHIEIENECAFDRPMGLRVSPDTLGLDWVPRIEILSREEIEKRDGERDRVVRRLRRETAKFGRSTGHIPATTMQLTATGRKRARMQLDDLNEAMPEHERSRWRCAWCRVSGQDTWEIGGPRKEYCRFCMPTAPSALAGQQQQQGGEMAVANVPQQQVPGIAENKAWRRGLYSSRNPINTPQVQTTYIGAR